MCLGLANSVYLPALPVREHPDRRKSPTLRENDGIQP